MEGPGNKENIYTPEWFKERAFDSLRKIEDGKWDYSDSLLLYTPGTEQEYESIQKGEDNYSNLVTIPERNFLKSISSNLVAQLPDNFEFIDLGPGTAHKEQFIFDVAKEKNKRFIYVPVDISSYYLKTASEYASAQGIEAKPLKSSFEELPDMLINSDLPRFVSLGLTFTNYAPQEILTLLCQISGKGGYFFVDVQDRERVNMADVADTYKDAVSALTDSKLRLLGLDPEKDVSESRTDDGVKMWCTLRNVTPRLEEKGIKPGDSLLLLQSLRYTRENFERELKAASLPYTIFETKDGFIGALIKT